MTFVRRRRRRRTPSSAEMGPAGPVRKDSCGVRHYGPASIALPFGWGRCSLGSRRHGAGGQGDTLCLRGPWAAHDGNPAGIRPNAGPPSTAVSPSGAGHACGPGSSASSSTCPAPEESQIGSSALEAVGVRATRGGRCPDRIPRLRQARIDSPPAITAGTGSLCPSKGCLAGRGVMICPRAAHARLRSPGVAVGERQDQSADRTAAHRLERDREAAVATSPLGCRAQAARAGSSRGPGSPEGNARHQAPAAAPAQARVRRPSS